jgi:hypothetical protein
VLNRTNFPSYSGKNGERKTDKLVRPIGWCCLTCGTFRRGSCWKFDIKRLEGKMRFEYKQSDDSHRWSCKWSQKFHVLTYRSLSSPLRHFVRWKSWNWKKSDMEICCTFISLAKIINNNN